MTTTSTARAADLMRAAFEGLAAHDPERATAFADEDTVDDFVVLGPIVGKAALFEFFAEMFAAVPDLEFDIVRILDVDENTAVGEWAVRGTFTGSRFQGIEATGRRIDLRGVDIMEFENGILRRNTIYYDGLTFARQIGLLPAEGTTTDTAMMSAFNALTSLKRRARRRSG